MFETIIHKAECLIYGLECLVSGTGSYWAARWALDKVCEVVLITVALVFAVGVYYASGMRAYVHQILRCFFRKVLRRLKRGFDAFNREADRQYLKRQAKRKAKAKAMFREACNKEKYYASLCGGERK